MICFSECTNIIHQYVCEICLSQAKAQLVILLWGGPFLRTVFPICIRCKLGCVGGLKNVGYANYMGTYFLLAFVQIEGWVVELEWGTRVLASPRETRGSESR